jgi:uncharacterized phiE125 gp8 family phage protein
VLFRSEAKLTLLVDHTADDTLITQLIEAATREVETLLARSLITQTREMVLSAWPSVRRNRDYPANAILLEHPPVQSITSVKYVTDAGVTVTMSNTDYEFISDTTPPYIWPGHDKTWPADTLRSAAPIRVRYLAGYGLAVAVPSDFKRLILGLVAVDYESREAINTGALAQRRRIESACRMHWGYAT